MKFFNLKLVFILLILSMYFVSCRKNVIESNENDIVKVKSLVDGYNILSFSTMEEFKKTLIVLNDKLEEYDDEFLKQHKDLSYDGLFNLEELIGYNEFRPLEEYEEKLNFYSLRKKLQEDLILFEDGNNLSTKDPFFDIIYDETLQTLLNDKREVIIDDTIYKLNIDGSYFIIDTVDFDLLSSIEYSNNYHFETLNDHVVFKGGTNVNNGNNSSSSTTSCDCGRNHDNNTKTVGNYKMKWKMKLYNYPWAGGFKMKVKGFKKKHKKWKKIRSYCALHFEGDFCDDNCGVMQKDGTYDKNNKKSFSRSTHGSTKSKDGDIDVTFTAVNISHTATLDIP